MSQRSLLVAVVFTMAAILLDHVAEAQQRNQLINQMIEQLRARPPPRSHSLSPSFSNSQRNFDVIGSGGLPLQGSAVDRPGRAFKEFDADKAKAASTSRTGQPPPPSIEDVITGTLSRFENSALKKTDDIEIDDEEDDDSLPFLGADNDGTDDSAEAKSIRRRKKPAAAEWPRYPQEPIILTPPQGHERPRKQKRPRKPFSGPEINSGKFGGPPPRHAPHEQRLPAVDEHNFPRRQGVLGFLSPAKNGPRPPPPPSSLLAPGGPYDNNNNGVPFRNSGPPPSNNNNLNRVLNAGSGGLAPRPPQFLGGGPPPPPPNDFRGPPRNNEGPPPRVSGRPPPAFLPQPIPRPGQDQRPPPPPPPFVKGKPVKKGAKRTKPANAPPGVDRPQPPAFQPPETIYHGFEPSFQGKATP